MIHTNQPTALPHRKTSPHHISRPPHHSPAAVLSPNRTPPARTIPPDPNPTCPTGLIFDRCRPRRTIPCSLFLTWHPHHLTTSSTSSTPHPVELAHTHRPILHCCRFHYAHTCPPAGYSRFTSRIVVRGECEGGWSLRWWGAVGAVRLSGGVWARSGGWWMGEVVLDCCRGRSSCVVTWLTYSLTELPRIPSTSTIPTRSAMIPPSAPPPSAASPVLARRLSQPNHDPDHTAHRTRPPTSQHHPANARLRLHVRSNACHALPALKNYSAMTSATDPV